VTPFFDVAANFSFSVFILYFILYFILFAFYLHFICILFEFYLNFICILFVFYLNFICILFVFFVFYLYFSLGLRFSIFWNRRIVASMLCSLFSAKKCRFSWKQMLATVLVMKSFI
jgi:hypothetical protein